MAEDYHRFLSLTVSLNPYPHGIIIIFFDYLLVQFLIFQYNLPIDPICLPPRLSFSFKSEENVQGVNHSNDT